MAEGNVQMDSGKVKAVVDWPQPTLIWDCTTLVAPLSALTSPKVPFKWSPAVDKAFVDLKHRFTTGPILIHPDPLCQFVVEEDASDVRVGAILSQRSAQDQKLHPWPSCPSVSILLRGTTMLATENSWR